MGSAQRGSKVIYDRSGSALAAIKPGMIDWQVVFADADWFHWTGITPPIPEGTATVCLEAAQTARKMGLTVSCNLNYRKKLWKWGKSAGEVMPDLVSLCGAAVGNEEDADKVFGIRAAESDVLCGQVEAEAYVDVCEKLAERFPNLKTVAITLRGSLSASHNTWSAILWRQGQIDTALRYDITSIARSGRRWGQFLRWRRQLGAVQPGLAGGLHPGFDAGAGGWPGQAGTSRGLE